MIERVITQPDPYEPFLLSQAIKANGWLFISGQAGAGENGKIVAGGFLAQGRQAFANLRREFFAAPYPADTIAEIRALYTPEAMIEIEAIACVPHQEGR